MRSKPVAVRGPVVLSKNSIWLKPQRTSERPDGPVKIMSCGDAKRFESIPVRCHYSCRVLNQKQQHAIDYLREENRVLREQQGTRRRRFTDDQRRRLAAKAKLVGRGLLDDIAEIVTPDTL